MVERAVAKDVTLRHSRRAMLGLGACGALALFASRGFGQLALPEADSGVTRVADLRYGSLPRQRLDAYLPARIRETTPLVLFWYGGAWRWGSKGRYGFVGEALAQQGIAAAVADYRLHPEVAFPEFIRDCAQATAWVLDRAGPDLGLAGLGGSRRLVLAGHSAGAYNAAMVALDPRYLAAFGRRPSEIAGWIGLAGTYDFLPLRYQLLRDVFGDTPDLEATQPIRFVRPGAPPALLVVGTYDVLINARESDALAARLTEVGVPARVLATPHSHRGVVQGLRDDPELLGELSRFARA